TAVSPATATTASTRPTTIGPRPRRGVPGSGAAGAEGGGWPAAAAAGAAWGMKRGAPGAVAPQDSQNLSPPRFSMWQRGQTQ
ncbi:MAG TPA: hypothetical protein VFC59_01020, partial [Cryobacterium sp.]|nr:hypothetical protein [Cryobacterium sp.]